MRERWISSAAVSYTHLDVYKRQVQNTDGSIAYNLMQQDMVALRAVMRLGWEIPNPINSVEEDKAKRCPFAVLKSGE